MLKYNDVRVNVGKKYVYVVKMQITYCIKTK